MDVFITSLYSVYILWGGGISVISVRRLSCSKIYKHVLGDSWCEKKSEGFYKYFEGTQGKMFLDFIS